MQQVQHAQPQAMQYNVGGARQEDVYEYMTDQDGRRFLVRSTSSAGGGHPKDKATQGHASVFNTTATGDMSQNVGFDVITGVDGIQYRVRRHPGETQMVGHTAPQPQLSGHHTSLQHSQPGHSSLHLQDRERGTAILDESRATRKLKFSDYLKRCPVKWAKDANPRNMNLSAFGYASLAELEGSMMSKTDPITQEELLARIRHTKNVFEVCCLNSKDSDFKPYGWVLARDYAAKVSNRVDQGFLAWEEMSAGVQTADLVSAQCDYPRSLLPPPPKQEKKDDKEEERKSRQKRLVTTYNTCDTEYTCDYEVSNPDKECQRIHECSWCRKHLKLGFRHQESRCQKKTE